MTYTNHQNSATTTTLKACAAVFLGVMLLGALAGEKTEKNASTDEARKLDTATPAGNSLLATTRGEVWNAQSMDAVRSRLKDGRSAEFRNVRFSDASGTPVTCGQVNAKNAFGGYSGFQGFIAGGPDRSLVFLEDEVTGFAAARRELCGE